MNRAVEIGEITSNKDFSNGSSLTVGFFDGVHRGHQVILSRTLENARLFGVPSIALTFDIRPKNVIGDFEIAKLINTFDEKVSLIYGFGLDLVSYVKFNPKFAEMPAEDFCEMVLRSKFNPRAITIGSDFRFGYRALGDHKFIKKFFGEFDIKVDVVDLLAIDGVTVSSTLIRNMIRSGKVSDAARFMGRSFSLYGMVVRGSGRGEKIGFPTLNLRPEPYLILPKDGVYAVIVELARKRLKGVLNIGVRPTFGESKRVIEVHIIDDGHQEAHQKFDVQFMDRLRDEIKFDSRELLTEQIKRDIMKTGEVLSGCL